MAVYQLILSERPFQLVENSLIGSRGPVGIHQLRKAQHTLVFIKWFQLIRRQHSPRLIQTGGRHTRRKHEEDIQRQPGRPLHHEPDPFDARHISDLMGIGNDGLGAVRNNGPFKLSRSHHGALQMNVAIYQSRTDDSPL